jgi:opacity protein-like surface antigen
MKKVLVTLVVLFLFAGISQAQNKMWLNIGGNVALPMGTFGDQAGTGFGGSAQFEMQFMPQLLGTGSIGYLTWGGKDVTQLGGTWSYSFSAVPVLVGAKYYFMPSGGFYGQAQIGIYFFSTTVDVPGYSIAGVTYGGGSQSESSSDFALSIGAGYELPLSPKLTLDLGLAFILISDANNLGIRAGIKFAL